MPRCGVFLFFVFGFLERWGRLGVYQSKFEEAKFSSTLFLSFDFWFWFVLSFSEMERGKFSLEVSKHHCLLICLHVWESSLWGTWKLEVGVMKLQYICLLFVNFSVPAIEAEVWLEFQKIIIIIIILLLLLLLNF